MFEFSINSSSDKVVVEFVGDFDIEATEVVEQDLTTALSSFTTPIEIDFSGVDFVDSSGIGLLITLISTLKSQGHNPTIINVNDDVQVVFDLLQLGEIIGADTFV